MKKCIKLISLTLISLGCEFVYSMNLIPTSISLREITATLPQLQNLIESIPIPQRESLLTRYTNLPQGGPARLSQFRALLTDAQNAYRAMPPPPVAEAIVPPVAVAEAIVVPAAVDEPIVIPAAVAEAIVVHPHLQEEQGNSDTELLEQPQFTTLKHSDLPIDRKKQLAAKLAPILRNTDTVAAYKTTFLPSYFFNLSNATLFAAANMLLQDPMIATWILEYKEEEIIGAREGDMQSILEYDLLHPQRERNHNRYQQLMMLIKLAYHNSLRDITYALVTSLNNPYAITGENIRALLLPFTERESNFLDAMIASLPVDVARIFKGNVQIFLNATRLCGRANIGLIDVLTMDSNCFSTSILKPSLPPGGNLLSILSAGSEIEITNLTPEVITRGNQYAERVFWKAVKYIFGYNEANDIETLFRYLDIKEPAGDHIGLLQAPISDLQSGSLCKLISIAYVRMFDKEKARVMRFTQRGHISYYEAGGVSGGAYPLLQARYIFRALEKQIKIYEDATETEAKKIEALNTMCIVLGSLIQGFNHCNAGVQGAYTQSITTLMSKENIKSIPQIARSIYETVAATFFSQIFKFSQPKNGRLDDWRTMDEEPEDILFNPKALQPIDEEIMRVKYVQKTLNGIYDILVPIGGYDSNDHQNSLNIHLISSRAIPSVVAALNALFENPDTRQWGISKKGELGTRALRWHLYDYSQENPDNYSGRMLDAQYVQVIKTLFNGALQDTALVLDEALNNPLVEKLIELYLQEKTQELRDMGLEVQDLTLQKLTEEDEMIKEMKKRIVWDVFRKEGFFQ